MKMFDLMKAKPTLDIPTLNWLWDRLWRLNTSTRATNAEGRARRLEREAILKMIQDEADDA